MNTFSADRARRKWATALTRCGQWTLAGSLLLFWAVLGVGAVPLPKPRPAQAPAVIQDETGPSVTTDDTPADEDLPADRSQHSTSDNKLPGHKASDSRLPKQSPCREALTEAIAIAPSVPPIRGPGGCGGEDLVRLEAVVLHGGERVAVKPAAILRCTMASAIADWVRTDMAPLASALGTALSSVDNFDAFECRGRNRVVGAKLSEHGLANALDVRGLSLANGKFVGLTDRAEPRDLRERVMLTVCSRFSTVLGPGSDWNHEDHIHLDLAERRRGYRTCQWSVYDPLPAVAPLLPAERPEAAPPRESEDGDKAGDTRVGESIR